MKWTLQTSGSDNWLRRIWGFDTNNIFAVGDYGTILYYDGTKWNKQNSGTNYLLLGIWGNRLDNVYVVGSSQRGRYDRLLDTSPESKPR